MPVTWSRLPLRSDPSDDAMQVSGRQLRDGGVELIVEDPSTDSLAVIQINSFDATESLAVKVGLRGNWDVADRPIRYSYVTMPAKKIGRAVREARKSAWLRKNEWRRTWDA